MESPLQSIPSITKVYWSGGQLTLRHACPTEYHRAQYAFKDSIIHEILQFTLLVAFHCVLHRCIFSKMAVHKSREGYIPATRIQRAELGGSSPWFRVDGA